MNNFVLSMLATIVGIVLLASPALADDSAFYFDESGKVQMNSIWSPISRRTTEEERRQYNAWANAQTLRKNEALVDEYYRSKPSAPPSRLIRLLGYRNGRSKRMVSVNSSSADHLPIAPNVLELLTIAQRMTHRFASKPIIE